MALSAQWHTPHYSSIDALREGDMPWVLQLTSIVAFALLTAVGAHIRIPLWEVPITMQTVAVYGSGLFLGSRNGFFAQILYLTMGLFLPVYAGGEMGTEYLFSSVTAGYLLAFPIAALITGLLSQDFNSLVGAMIVLFAASTFVFITGAVWLHFAAEHATWGESLTKGWFRFIPIDLAKIFFVSSTYAVLRRIFMS
jgi:biotin transport system substrate-specific component